MIVVTARPSCDGNTTDDTLHVETWLRLRGMIGKSDFLYVADSKLCTSKNMQKIDHDHGRFVTIVPRTRAETKEFALKCHLGEIRWEYLTKRPTNRRKGEFDRFNIACGFYQLDEGYTLYWYKSSEKKKRDEASRTERIEVALLKLDELKERKPRGPKTPKSLLKKAKIILARYKVEDWLNVEIDIQKEENFKKTSKGKPGPDATYRRTVKSVPYLVVSENQDEIAKSRAVDGIFPLVTNAKLSAKETLDAYKYQPNIEKIFSYMKSDYQVAPVFLKNTDRIEAVMFVYYLSNLITALIQRQVRNNMAAENITKINTLPEKRKTSTPTWEQIQRLFQNHSKYELYLDDKLIKTFSDDLSLPQIQILELLHLPLDDFS